MNRLVIYERWYHPVIAGVFIACAKFVTVGKPAAEPVHDHGRVPVNALPAD
jgi:hypothetical protein